MSPLKETIIGFYLPEDENGCFSNWHMSDFVADGVQFSSMEQFLMYQKAVVCHDDVRAKLILASDDPATVKNLGDRLRRTMAHSGKASARSSRTVGCTQSFRRTMRYGQRCLQLTTVSLQNAVQPTQSWGSG